MESFDLQVLLGATTAFGAAVTKILDAIRNTADPEGKWPKAVWNIGALAVGVGIALLFDVTAFAGPAWFTQLGHILTGLAIGAAASGWHEVFDALSGVAKSQHLAGGNPPRRVIRDADARTEQLQVLVSEAERATTANKNLHAALASRHEAKELAHAADKVVDTEEKR